ncbi:metal-dependent hydrolase [Chloroflexota bacterium]
MLVLGHPGITIGAAALVKIFIGRALQPVDKSKSTVVSFLSNIDARLLLLASFLPDIFDKPLGMFILRDSVSNGRIYFHTLLFWLVITAAGLYLYRRRAHTWLLVLSFGTFMHLVLDEMWHMPVTLFWPLLGTTFPRYELGGLGNWLQSTLDALFTQPGFFIPEIIGGLFLSWFFLLLVRKRRVLAFLRHGRVL